jgi:hypothetical protein
MNKNFKLKAEQIKRLVDGKGPCVATDMITVEGKRVGYMYREPHEDASHSGWCFMSGDETQEYMDNPDNLAIYDVNTICNYDPDIIPFLDAPFNSAFARDARTGKFVKEEFRPIEE